MYTLLRIELQPLATHWYKVNFYGIIFDSVNSAGLGVVIRNCESLVMSSLSQLVHLRTMVIEEETLATRRALELAIELGFDNLVLEGDSKASSKSLRVELVLWAQYGYLANDIHFLALHFSAFKISYVRSNKVAYSLARRAIISPPVSIWMEDVLPNLLSVLQADLNSLFK